MSLPKPTNRLLSVLAGLFLCLSASAQSPAQNVIRWFNEGDSLETRRWELSTNILGPLEGPLAVGAGVGYQLNPRIQLWSETSLLRNGWFGGVGYLAGIREILQMKYFLNRKHNFFVAVEGRYKSYTFNDTTNFYNPHTDDTVMNRPYHEHHYFWGVGFQIGKRWKLSNNGRWQLEATFGIGFKYKYIDWRGISNDYEKLNRSVDLNARDIMDHRGATAYLPGSLRIIYTFGNNKL
jgi:hypothetical protein